MEQGAWMFLQLVQHIVEFYLLVKILRDLMELNYVHNYHQSVWLQIVLKGHVQMHQQQVELLRQAQLLVQLI